LFIDPSPDIFFSSPYVPMLVSKPKSFYFPGLFQNGGQRRNWGGCFRYLLSTKGTFLLSDASRPPPFTHVLKNNYERTTEKQWGMYSGKIVLKKQKKKKDG